MSTTLPTPRSARADPIDEAPVTTRREHVQYAAAIGAAVVLVLYGLQYYALESFYGRFGITPEQLGIGKTELLTRLAVRLGFLGFLVALVLPVMLAVVVLVVGTFVPRGVSDFLRHRSAAQAWFRRGLLVLGTAAWLALTTEEISEGHVFGPPTAFGFVIGLIYAAAVVAAASPGSPRRRKARELGITLTVCVLAFGYWLGNAMEEGADHVRASGHAGLLAQLVGVRVDLVCVDLADTAGITDAGDFPGLHLGESGGVHTVYDISEQKKRRVPVAQTRLWAPAPGGGTERFEMWRECGGKR
ncbi:hypothetical protein [Streptomyces microflavus]|uniref:hypothetical protein n=1 Tax=Streptomyces microflavus TaxID=1919 RepID=UPI0036B31EFF